MKPASTSPKLHSSPGLPCRQLSFSGGREIGVSPLQLSDVHRPKRRRFVISGLLRPHIPVGPCVWSSRPQAVERIDHERQRFVVNDDLFDRFGRRQFVDRRDGENRLALEHRLHRQRSSVVQVDLDLDAEIGHASGGLRQVVGRDDGFDARHRQRRGRVDVADTRVWQRAQEQLGEQHPVRAVIVCEFRAPSDLCHDVRRRVVLANQLDLSHRYLLPGPAAPCSDDERRLFATILLVGMRKGTK